MSFLADFDKSGKAIFAKFQIWLKIHDLDSELNENHGNQFFIYMLKTINEVGALTELFSSKEKTND
ncbi:hypothetical protein OUZ56_002051 [Daphnia magna]|uniref:Uncharacterized protein n=1 Tax=Daphnia magna TaxID=35525 RepID=A0ABR0A4J7_9CRUS|nr:hypothetical protein OUZ56_002051 [Daphnia magna]